MSTEQNLRVREALNQHGPLASPALRQRIEAEIARANRRRRPARPLLRRLAPAGAIAASLAVLALLLPAIFGGADPSIGDVHRLNADGPEAPAPPAVQGAENELAAEVDGVHFPNPKLRPGFEWKAVGERSDELAGRTTRTVFYEHEGHLVGYTIVSGSPLTIPADAEVRHKHGVDVALLRDEHGHDIAVFERGGKTCVISGHVEKRSTFVRLATWSGHGQLSF
jgi:hypothetical protein